MARPSHFHFSPKNMSSDTGKTIGEEDAIIKNLTIEHITKWMDHNPEMASTIIRTKRASAFVQSQIQVSDEHSNVISFGGFDLKSCLKSIFSTVSKLIVADRCSIFLFDPEKKDLYSFVFDAKAGSESLALARSSAPEIVEHHVPSGTTVEGRLSISELRRDQQARVAAFSTLDNRQIRKSEELLKRANENVGSNKAQGIRIPLGLGIAGMVAKTLKGINIVDAYNDPRFNSDMDKKTGFKTESMLCLPIFGISDKEERREFLGVATLINKRTAQGKVTAFTAPDEAMFAQLLVLVGVSLKAASSYQESRNDEFEAASIALKNSLEYQKAKIEMYNGQALLKMARTFYKEEDVNSLIRTIVGTAKELMMADKSSLFLVDKEKKLLKSTIFDNGTEKVMSFSMDRGIAGAVASTGVAVNIPNAYDDPRFNKEIDLLTNYKTHSLMCIPIFGPNGEIIGVANMINKQEPEEAQLLGFSDADLKLFQDFAVFCGLALHKALMINEIETHRARLAITMDLMNYHTNVRDDEVMLFKEKMPTYHMPIENIQNWTFDAHNYQCTDEILSSVVYQMMNNLNYGSKFDIDDGKLIHYLLVVRRNYRPIAYHNHGHAVSVTHAVFIWILSGMLDTIMDPVEQFAMFVAALNHDIDHRGTNNQFQKMAHTDLARFYDSSTMERHHFNHTMAILNSSQNLNILSSFGKADYKRCLVNIEKCILATDLSQFFGSSVPIHLILEKDKGTCCPKRVKSTREPGA